MPVRKELTVRTTELRKGDVVKKWPGGSVNLLGARVAVREYGDVWHSISFEEHKLPKTKRWKSTWEWTIWREEPTELETANAALEIAEKKLLRAANASLEGLQYAHKKVSRLPATAQEDPTHELQAYMIAWCKRKPWEDMIALWEARNKRLADGFPTAKEDPFPNVPQWSIGHAAYTFIERYRKSVLEGRIEMNPRWSDPFMNYFRILQAESEYKAATEMWSSMGQYADEWHTAWKTVQREEAKAYESGEWHASQDRGSEAGDAGSVHILG